MKYLIYGLSLICVLVVINCFSSAQSYSQRYIPNRVPQKITYYNITDSIKSGDWDTTSHLPPNMTAPVVIEKVKPDFPMLAIRAHIEAKIIAKVWIDKLGEIRKVLIKLSGGNLFEEATIDAVKLWKFKPFLVDNEPKGIWMSLEFNYIFIDDEPEVLMPE